MTEKDLEEFEKKYGFKLHLTTFKKPMKYITKEEYEEKAKALWEAIINDDSGEDENL